MISVIIPVWNGENYLAEAVNSVNRQNSDTEIIVVDDGSTDNTAKLAKSFGCRIVSIPHKGSSVARNVGLTVANGDTIMFLDHDDVLTEGSLDRLDKSLISGIDFVSAKVRDFLSPELSNSEKYKLVPRKKAYGGLLTGAYLFRQSVFVTVGGFNERLMTGECIDLLFRCSDLKLKELRLDFISAHRRLHLFNKGRIMRTQENKDYSAILREKIKKGE
ncbi:MAG: glycosyltransferase [Spirochaetaceae bacterium]|jgi:glycosyltransferase involved in cell wall biosynthesis|nr:glycosyltransferase [Spirochaetaceae bacterium]